MAGGSGRRPAVYQFRLIDAASVAWPAVLADSWVEDAQANESIHILRGRRCTGPRRSDRVWPSMPSQPLVSPKANGDCGLELGRASGESAATQRRRRWIRVNNACGVSTQRV
jgi:hypothetical protein